MPKRDTPTDRDLLAAADRLRRSADFALRRGWVSGGAPAAYLRVARWIEKKLTTAPEAEGADG